MEFATDHLVARILLTLNVLGYSLGPCIADFNKTHATNPQWVRHARFHVVWQVLSYCGVGLISLGLIWIAGPTAVLRLWIAAALAAAVYLSFYTTAFSMRLFGGSVSDPNGVPPIATVQLGGRPVALDTNVVVFCVQIVILLIAVILLF
jgi:hypothetical protein